MGFFYRYIDKQNQSVYGEQPRLKDFLQALKAPPSHTASAQEIQSSIKRGPSEKGISLEYRNLLHLKIDIVFDLARQQVGGFVGPEELSEFPIATKKPN